MFRFRILTDLKINLQKKPIQGKSFWRVSRFASLSQKKWFCIRRPNLALESLEPIFNHSQHPIQSFDRLQNKSIRNSKKRKKFLEISKVCLVFPEKWFCIPQLNLALKTLNQYSITLEIPFRSLTEFKTNLQETPIQKESFWKVSRFALFSQRNGFTFVDQIWHYKALNQY